MLENLFVEIAEAQQQDRRIAMEREVRLAEAMRTAAPRARFMSGQRRRAAIARVLRALAFKLAPANDGQETAQRRPAGAQP